MREHDFTPPTFILDPRIEGEDRVEHQVHLEEFSLRVVGPGTGDSGGLERRVAELAS